MAFFTKSQVKSSQHHLPSCYCSYRAPSPASFKLSRPQNVRKGDVPMALLPDPTTAASERSSVKNRLTGSRRRGSGINRHRSRTVSKTSLRGRHRVQAHPGGGAGPEQRIRQTFRSCLSSLTRRCIQDCVQEVPVKQVAQGTPPQRTPRPSQVASTGFINLSMAFFTKSQVKSSQHHLPSCYCSYRAPSPASFKLSQPQNVRKGDVPMALLPDPTTAASERSSVKNRLTGSRRRGSGIKNRHRSRTVSKTSLRGAGRMRAQGVQGQGCPQHESTQPGPLTLLPHKTRVRHKNRHRSKRSAKRV